MNAPASFRDFQHAFARHLRDPHHVARPAGLPARRSRVYERLLFNNVRGFVDRCFPVCRTLLGEARWTRLIRCFYRDWPMATPWFREIPREFVRYLSEADIAMPRPRWLADFGLSRSTRPVTADRRWPARRRGPFRSSSRLGSYCRPLTASDWVR